MIVLFALTPVRSATAQIERHSGVGQEICNVRADYFLGVENYPEAIRLHRQVLVREPRNALAHYHLGFAYAMAGKYGFELAEYRRAIELGLTDWTLFLNLGLAYFQRTDFRLAADALKVSELLAQGHVEPHYNLALVYERLGMLSQAEQEALTALELNPRDPDIRNTLAIVYAERGNYARAREEWSALLAENPRYLPAKANLAILNGTAVADAAEAGRDDAPSVSRAAAGAQAPPPSANPTPLHRAGPELVLELGGVSQWKLGPISAKGGDD